MLKGQKGITLIALIITIVVLIILAGVTITIALKDNGIFNKANQAANAYKNASENEANWLNETNTQLDTVWDEYGPQDGE